MRNMFTVLCLMFSLQSMAAEKLMATITSDVDGNVCKFYLETKEDGTADGVRVFMTDEFGAVVSDDFHLAERVMAEGITIIEQQGREAVRLEVENFSVETGGTIVMNYLYNGITGSRRNTKLKMFRKGADFFLTDLMNAPVNRLYVYGNRIRIVGLVGIRDVVASFSSSFLKR